MQNRFKKYLAIISLSLLAFYTPAQAAYTVDCPLPIYPSNFANPVVCTGCSCVCPHPTDPLLTVTVKPGQSVHCFDSAPSSTLPGATGTTYCVPTGPPVVDCNGDSSAPNADMTWLPPPAGYTAPAQPKLIEGFWKGFFNIAIPGAGDQVESHLSGPHANEGLDDPVQDLYLSSQMKVLPFCAAPRPQPCFDLHWRAKLSNCLQIPKGQDASGVSTFQNCMGDMHDFLNCLSDLNNGGPWDIGRLRDQGYTPNPATYMADAQAAATAQANTCIEERPLYAPPYEGGFDAANF